MGVVVEPIFCRRHPAFAGAGAMFFDAVVSVCAVFTLTGGQRTYPSKSCFVGPCFFTAFAGGTFTAVFLVAAFFRALVFSEDS